LSTEVATSGDLASKPFNAAVPSTSVVLFAASASAALLVALASVAFCAASASVAFYVMSASAAFFTAAASACDAVASLAASLVALFEDAASSATFFDSAAFFASATFVAVAPHAGAGFFRTFCLALQDATVSSSFITK
jgi:hypothetical protein